MEKIIIASAIVIILNKKFFRGRRLPALIKYIWTGVIAGTVLAYTVYTKLPIRYISFRKTVMSISMLSGIVLSIIIWCVKTKAEKKRKTEFSLSVNMAYGRMERLINDINTTNMSLTQIEMQRLTPCLRAYEKYRKQIMSGRVDLDIIKQIRYHTKTLEEIYHSCVFRTKQKVPKTEKVEKKPEQMEEFSFFTGCDDIDSVRKRYKNLCKAYHPDTGSGDSNAFKELNRQYKEKEAEYTK